MKTFIVYLLICGDPAYFILGHPGNIVVGKYDSYNEKQQTFLDEFEKLSGDNVYNSEIGSPYGCT